jgi:hypothetical protein
MKRLLPVLLLVSYAAMTYAQTNPAITTWLRNNTNIKGRHYVAGNSTPINDTYPANVQSVKYSANWVYVTCSGIPSYVIGPYLDGNPSQGINENNIYKISLSPIKNTGTPTNTTGGTIGVFINGVSLFDYRDGVSYNISSGTNQGGPLGGMGNMVWNRDAVVAERVGFDCAKGHPAMGNYHHHQNPSAFKLDLKVISNICDLYLSDALYVIDSTVHSPLLGFAYDGFPIYGAYGYKNTNGTGGIVRMKSSYSLRNITARTHYADGTDVTDGPPVSTTYPLGMYREDYQYNPTSPATPDYLDEHNGRFCITPEYPNGTYCYFATVDKNWNSAYPYIVGPTFYGVKNTTRVTGISEATTTYNGLPLVVSATPTQVACKGNATGAITLTVSGGNPPFTYNWGGGVTTKDRTGLTAGTYTVTVTDVTAQTSTQTITIIQPQDFLAATALAVPVRCFGNASGAISLQITGGTSGYQYLWNDGSTTQDRTQLPAGTYGATVTDANGCTTTVSQSISQPVMPLMVASTTSPVACFGDTTGSIQLTTSGGTSGYTFMWNDGNTGQNRTVIPAGTYTVTITDSHNCTETASQTIAQPAAPLTTSVSATDVACFGDASGTILLQTAGGTAGYSFAWNDGPTTSDRTALPAGAYSVTITDSNHCTATAVRQISQPAGPLGVVSAVIPVNCFGDASGVLNLAAYGGTTGYAFLWNDGNTSQNRSNLAAGTYLATITDANGCTTTISTDITQPVQLTGTTTATDASCGDSNGAVELVAAGGITPYFYNWSGGQTTQSITSISSGSYTVTIMDANGCTSQNTALISNLNGPVASTITTPAHCFGISDGAIEVSTSGGTPPFTFQWNDGSDQQSRTNLAAGSYVVTIEDANHCKAILAATITQPAALSGNTMTSPEACLKGDGLAAVFVNGGTTPYAYQWNNGGTNASLMKATAGEYSVTVTDGNGCTATYSATVGTVDGPIASAASTNVGCFGAATGSIQLVVGSGTQPFGYQWSNGSTAALLSGVAAGSYTATVTDANGCTAIVSETITQPVKALLVDGQVTNILCQGFDNGAINLTVDGGTAQYGFVWNTGNTTQNLSGLAPGFYKVTVTDANGCTATFGDAINQPALPLSLDVASITPIDCFGNSTGSITLSAFGGIPGYQFDWGGGLNSPTISNLPTGTYTATVTDANGCSGSIVVVLPQPTQLTTTTASTPSTGSDNGTATATGAGGAPPYAYTWDNTATGNHLEGLPPGNYTVTVTDANGCTTTGSVTVELMVGTANPLDQVSLKVFPNPSSELILIQSQVILRNTLHLELKNAAGQVVMGKDFLQGSTICHFETDTLYDGMYILTATDGYGSKVFKVIVRR